MYFIRIRISEIPTHTMYIINMGHVMVLFRAAQVDQACVDPVNTKCIKYELRIHP